MINSCEGKEIPMSQGGTVHTYFDQNQAGEIPMELPTDQEYVLKVGNGQFIVKTSEESLRSRFKFDRVQGEREDEYQTQEYDEPVWDDENTQFNSNIGEVDPQELPDLEKDLELKETDFDQPEKELKEKSGETEKDFEKELEKEKEKEKELERERELEKERETEKEKERERELEREKEKQREREKQAEKDKKDRETQRRSHLRRQQKRSRAYAFACAR